MELWRLMKYDQVTTTRAKNQKLSSKIFEKYLFSCKAEVHVSCLLSNRKYVSNFYHLLLLRSLAD